MFSLFSEFQTKFCLNSSIFLNDFSAVFLAISAIFLSAFSSTIDNKKSIC